MKAAVPAGFLALCLAGPAAGGHGQHAVEIYDPTRPSWYFTGFHGKAQLFLGSEDPRTASGLALGYGRPEPRLRYRHTLGQLILEGYFEHSRSPGASGVGPNETTAYGALAIGRYFWKKGDTPVYFDIGFGAQYASMRTVDLESRFNTTPMIGIGLGFPSEEYEVLVGLRLLHISNAGTSGDNQGQNQLLVTVSYRF